MKDYYQILEVDKNSSEDEIKSAFRKKAIQWHPDKNQGDKKAEEKFKEINEAYEILGNVEKREQYDNPRLDTQYFGCFDNLNHSDFFDNFFKQHFSQTFQGQLSIPIEKAYKGCKENIFINGKNYAIEVPPKSAKGRSFLVNISNNERLIVHLDVKDSEEFQIRGYDLHSYVKVLPFELVLGCKKKIDLFGEKAYITIPKKILSTQKIRIAHKGFIGDNGYIGDLYFQVVVTPETISEIEIKLYKKIQKLRSK